MSRVRQVVKEKGLKGPKGCRCACGMAVRWLGGALCLEADERAQRAVWRA